MIKGKTATGFNYAIDEHKLDDMELFDLISESEDNPMLSSKILLKILGKDQRQKLYDHCRTAEGNVPVEKTLNELAEIFENSQPLKK